MHTGSGRGIREEGAFLKECFKCNMVTTMLLPCATAKHTTTNMESMCVCSEQSNHGKLGIKGVSPESLAVLSWPQKHSFIFWTFSLSRASENHEHVHQRFF